MFRIAVLIGALALGQNSPRVGLLDQEGWAAIKAGNHQAALEAFREAIRLDPKNAWLRLGAGTAEFLARRDPEAKAHLEQALSLEPTLVRARAQLAQVVKRQGDLNEAIRLYEQVAVDVPNDEGVRDTLDRWKRERELHERMRLEVGDFFTVSFEGAEDAALAAQAIESLNRAYWRIGDLLGAYPPKSVPVVLYTGEQFQDVTRSPKWAAAAFDGIIRVPMRGAGEKGDDLDRVLAHEFTHALIRSMATSQIPTWLNEGLASVLESDSLEWATSRLEKVERLPSLRELSGPFGKLSGADAQVAYAASALAARRLLEEAGGAAIANLLRDLGAGVDFESAFLHRMQKTLADFEASLK
ncbi:MAG TPA: tetratricopeptide repeat protein [Vicinamibacterales bacterium]|nr:tetratricopeptide repeat protein [Vicinamibacterales bacterium]